MSSIGTPSILPPNSSIAIWVATTGPMQLPLQYWPEKSSSTPSLILLSENCACALTASIITAATAAMPRENRITNPPNQICADGAVNRRASRAGYFL